MDEPKKAADDEAFLAELLFSSFPVSLPTLPARTALATRTDTAEDSDRLVPSRTALLSRLAEASAARGAARVGIVACVVDPAPAVCVRGEGPLPGSRVRVFVAAEGPDAGIAALLAKRYGGTDKTGTVEFNLIIDELERWAKAAGGRVSSAAEGGYCS